MSDNADLAENALGDDQHALEALQNSQQVQELEALDGVDSGFTDSLSDDTEGLIETDDLTLIDGVGPALQERLYAFGYTRWADLAELNDEAAEKLSIQLELDDQIKEQNWSGQAHLLMESKL